MDAKSNQNHACCLDKPKVIRFVWQQAQNHTYFLRDKYNHTILNLTKFLVYLTKILTKKCARFWQKQNNQDLGQNLARSCSDLAKLREASQSNQRGLRAWVGQFFKNSFGLAVLHRSFLSTSNRPTACVSHFGVPALDTMRAHIFTPQKALAREN